MTSTIHRVTGPSEGLERRVDMLMASLRADQDDATTYFAVFCAKMLDALGPRVVTDKGGGAFRKRAAPSHVSISIGEFQYRASFVGGAMVCEESHIVRGITLGSIPMDFPQWLERVVDTLALEAERSESTRIALEHLLA
jgi:hypothetical protein